MQAILGRLRSQSSQKVQETQISNVSSDDTNPEREQPESALVTAPLQTTTAVYAGARKIHPNPDELLSSAPTPSLPTSPVRKSTANELGIRVPSALARVANRKVTPTVSQPTEDTIRESPELERDQLSTDSHPQDKLPESPSPRRASLSLFSAVPFSSGTGWSTFGRGRKDNNDAQADGPPLPDASRTSSQSRTTTTTTRTPPTKSSALSRSNSTKQPMPTSDSSSYSRVPLNNDHHDNAEPKSPNTQNDDQAISTSANLQRASVFNNISPAHEHIDATYPPRTTVVKPDAPATTSLPFTFGRQPPTRPSADDVFVSEFGSEQPDVNLSKLNPTPPPPAMNEAFPTLETPSSERPLHGLAHRPNQASDASELLTTTSRYGIPSLISDSSLDNPHREEASSSAGTSPGWPWDLPIRNMASFGASGDELSHPREAALGTRIRNVSDDGRRRRSASGSSSGLRLRRSSGGKRLSALLDQGTKADTPFAISPPSPITVFSAEVPNSQDFPTREESAISPSGHAQRDTSATAVDEPSPSTSTAPNVSHNPRPSTSRSPSTRLQDIFAQNIRVPEGYAHASGIGVAGIEPHSRRQSIKVMGKRKAGEAVDPEEIVIQDNRGHRPRFDSNAPSSYYRKRMKLSSNASEKDALPLRTSTSASRSAAPSVRSVTSSSRPTTSHRRPLSHNASAVSIPVSAIVSPRAPSIRHSISGTSKRGDGMRYQHPLKNRVQRRKKRETWADSWILDRDDMPIQAWLFLAGFVFPLCWWIGMLLPIRRQQSPDAEKGEPPTIGVVDRSHSGLWTDSTEYDMESARLWRGRCLAAAIISTVIYVPIIACAVVFSRR